MSEGAVGLLDEAVARCADEPIHVPGSVQPHGFFLLTEGADGRVVVASENAAEYLGVPLKLVLGARLGELLDREVMASIAVVKSTIRPEYPTKYLGAFRVGKELFSVLSHCVGDKLAVEFERVDRVVSPELMNAVVTNFVSTLGSVPTEGALCRAVTQQVHEITGYDRTLLYCFDREGNGHVLAEVSNGRLPSYLDLHFPASDIPAQARALYLKNTTRIIPDADYTPSPLRGLAGEDAGAVDLSQSVLRSVSPVHLEYMRNMGTMSSMSVSIVVDGKLWGLISGHNAEAKTVPFLIRSACDMLAKMMSTQLTSLRASERLRRTVEIHDVQRRVLTRLASGTDFLQNLHEQMPELLGLAQGSGVALVAAGHVDKMGVTPDDEAIRKIASWLDTQPERDVLHTDALSSAVGGTEAWADGIRAMASGVLAVRISSVQQRYVLWFRPEVVQTVGWAGEPPKPGEPKQLHPRSSFETWKETVRGRSAGWSDLEVESAGDFRAALTGMSLRRAEETIELGEARFQQLTAAIPARVFACDDSGRLTYVNQRWPAAVRTTRARWFDEKTLLAEDSARCAEMWAEAVAEGRPFEAEVRLRDAGTGAHRWNFVRAVPFQRAGQARAGWVGTFVDLTDSKERELALRMNEKLALSGRMTSVIAHEINNPLEAITNLMYLLRSEVPGTGLACGYIGMVEAELERISGITKQTLRWNREHTDAPKEFTAGAVADDVLRLFAGKIRNREVTAAVEGERELRMRGVVGQIRQALANLVSNAIDAAPVGGRVVVEVVQDDAGMVGFAVRDNGPGLSDVARERLFEPFFTTKGDLGNGLGLYITQEIVEQHGGRLAVESGAHGARVGFVWPG